MQRLTLMTLGAAFIGLCGFVYDANAQTPARTACPTHAATVYFAPDSNELGEHQNLAIATMANAARSCGAKAVIIEASSGLERADVVADALGDRGVRVQITPGPTLIPAGDTMIARSVTLRVATGGNVAS